METSRNLPRLWDTQVLFRGLPRETHGSLPRSCDTLKHFKGLHI
jgi:hypothetical protein